MTPDGFRMRNTGRNRDDQREPKLALYGLGVAGEAGEVADEIKKVLFHAKPLDINKLLTEIGDVLWYLDRLTRHLGFDLGDAMEAVTAKLDARYPNGFVEHAKRTDIGAKS